MAFKVIIGMSGGVDSSVGAYLLKKAGYEVIGVTMQIWQDDAAEEKGGCCSVTAAGDARMTAHALDIPFYVLNFKNVFKEKVIDYFVDEYMRGRTPNPCIVCNTSVKWEALLKKAMGLGADYIATGHYAGIGKQGDRIAVKALGHGKDQSYALYGLSQFQLEHTLFPLEGLTKPEIRNIAKEIGLNIHNKPDSQEICFVNDGDYGGFIEKSGRNAPPGDFVDIGGNFLGKHKGIIHYTVGQRKGLGVAFGKPMFVKSINPASNEIILADNEELFSKGLLAGDINFMALDKLDGEIECLAKIRYSHKPVKARIIWEGGKLKCLFAEPQRAVTPGQAAVFYDSEGRILCGGVIESQI